MSAKSFAVLGFCIGLSLSAASPAWGLVEEGVCPQVLVEARLIEVCAGTSHQLGVDLPFHAHEHSHSQAFVDGRNTGLSGQPTTGLAGDWSATAITDALVGKMDPVTTILRGIAGVDHQDLQVGQAVNAQFYSGVAVPVVATSDNAQADIRLSLDFTAELRRPEGAQTGDGYSQIYMAITVIDVSDPLSPLLLQTGQAILDGDGLTTGGLLDSSVILNGDTATVDLQRDMDLKVPVLSDIAVIGQLFGYARAERQTELITIITPYIVDSDQSAVLTVSALEGSTLTVVPEPATAWVLLGLGMWCCRGRRRSRRFF